MFALPIARKIELLDHHVHASLPRLGLGESDARDLGRAVGDLGDVHVVDVGHVLARDALGDRVALGEGDVGELQGRGGDVADRPDVRDVRPELRVDVHEALLVYRDAGVVEAESLGDGPATDRHQADVGGHGLRLAPDLVGHLDRVVRVDHGRHRRAGRRRDAALAVGAGDLLGDLLVLERSEAGERLEQGDVGAEGPVHGGELEPYRAGADHDGRGRDPVVPQGLVARDDPVRQREPGQQPRTRPRGDHDVVRLDPAAVDLDGRAVHELGGAGHDVDLALRDEPGHALHELVDDLLLEGLDRRPVGFARGLDAPLGGAVDGVHHGGRLQQGLRGDAAAEQARAAEAVVALDQDDAQAEFGGAQGGGIPPGPGSDHDYVVRITHPVRKSTRVRPARSEDAVRPPAVRCRRWTITRTRRS